MSEDVRPDDYDLPGSRLTGGAQPSSTDAEAGEAVCWAQLVCPECGAVTTEGHRESCSLAVPAVLPGDRPAQQ